MRLEDASAGTFPSSSRLTSDVLPGGDELDLRRRYPPSLLQNDPMAGGPIGIEADLDEVLGWSLLDPLDNDPHRLRNVRRTVPDRSPEPPRIFRVVTKVIGNLRTGGVLEDEATPMGLRAGVLIWVIRLLADGTMIACCIRRYPWRLVSERSSRRPRSVDCFV